MTLLHEQLERTDPDDASLLSMKPTGESYSPPEALLGAFQEQLVVRESGLGSTHSLPACRQFGQFSPIDSKAQVRPYSKRVREKREGEKDRLVLLMRGRDDLLLLAHLNSSAVLSDNDIPVWRSSESLRIRTRSGRYAAISIGIVL